MHDELSALGAVIGNVGVPTALCFYIIFTLNKNVNRLTTTLDNWSKLIEKRLDLIEKRLERLES